MGAGLLAIQATRYIRPVELMPSRASPPPQGCHATASPNFPFRCQHRRAADFLRHCFVIFLSYRTARVCA
ncbi:hypothetical protein C7A07_17240 [Pseudomonas fragi]|nr:hypothetical protein C7A07_17240 [Pseudomonas fragi]